MYCKKVIGKNKDEPVFCGGNLATQTYVDGGKTYQFQICERCGYKPSLAPDELDLEKPPLSLLLKNLVL